MTDEEERAAAYLESCARRKSYQSARERGLRGSEGARHRVDLAWDAMRAEPVWEPKRLKEARKVAEALGCDDAANEST